MVLSDSWTYLVEEEGGGGGEEEEEIEKSIISQLASYLG